VIWLLHSRFRGRFQKREQRERKKAARNLCPVHERALLEKLETQPSERVRCEIYIVVIIDYARRQ